VQDTGAGISPSDQVKIVFEEIPAVGQFPRTKVKGGHRARLSIVQRIVGLHGAASWCRRPGQRPLSSSRTDNRLTSQAGHAYYRIPWGRSGRQPAILRDSFAHAIRVRRVTTATGAVLRPPRHRPDLILMDSSFQLLDGYEKVDRGASIRSDVSITSIRRGHVLRIEAGLRPRRGPPL